MGGNDFFVRYPVVKIKKICPAPCGLNKKPCPAPCGLNKKPCPAPCGSKNPCPEQRKAENAAVGIRQSSVCFSNE